MNIISTVGHIQCTLHTVCVCMSAYCVCVYVCVHTVCVCVHVCILCVCVCMWCNAEVCICASVCVSIRMWYYSVYVVRVYTYDYMCECMVTYFYPIL